MYVPYVLTCLSRDIEGSVVYTDKKSIFELFSANCNVIVIYDSYAYKYLYDKIKIDFIRKKTIRKQLQVLNIDCVYFFHEAYCECANWIINSYKKRNCKIIYYPIANTYSYNTVYKTSIKTFILWVYNVFMWNFPHTMIIDNNDVFCLLTRHFFEGISIISNYKVDPSSIKKYIKNLSLNKDDNSIIWLDNPMVHMGMSLDSYNNVNDIILPGLVSEYSVLFKGHPDRVCCYGIEKKLKQIPSYISGNLLIYSYNIFIGVNSALLAEAANNGCLAICTIYMYEMDQNQRDIIFDYLNQLSSQILYPKNINQFQILIKNAICKTSL